MKGSIMANDEEANDDLVTRLVPGQSGAVEPAEAEPLAAVAAGAALATSIRVVNRAMIKSGEPDEPIPQCIVKIGTGAGQVTGLTLTAATGGLTARRP
jgi:hypothetical protein